MRAGVGCELAGELADAVAKLRARTAALVAALSAAGGTTALSGSQLATIRAEAAGNFPATLLNVLRANGVSPSALQHALAAAVAHAPPTIPFSQLLAVTEPTAPYVASNRSITVAQVGAIVDALTEQHAISARLHAQLTADLETVSRSGDRKRTRAISRLLSDIAMKLHGRAGMLLQFAAAGLH